LAAALSRRSLIGQSIDRHFYDQLNPYTGEMGSDGVVRTAGANLNASRAFANKLLAKIRYVPGVADPRIQEQFQNPALKVDFNRELAGVVGLTEGDAATSIQATLSGSTQTAPTYWLNPTNGVSYPVSVQTPQYGIDTLGELKNLPLTAAQSTQLLGGLATFSPEPRDAALFRAQQAAGHAQ